MGGGRKRCKLSKNYLMQTIKSGGGDAFFFLRHQNLNIYIHFL